MNRHINTRSKKNTSVHSVRLATKTPAQPGDGQLASPAKESTSASRPPWVQTLGAAQAGLIVRQAFISRLCQRAKDVLPPGIPIRYSPMIEELCPQAGELPHWRMSREQLVRVGVEAADRIVKENAGGESVDCWLHDCWRKLTGVYECDFGYGAAVDLLLSALAELGDADAAYACVNIWVRLNLYGAVPDWKEIHRLWCAHPFLPEARPTKVAQPPLDPMTFVPPPGEIPAPTDATARPPVQS
jgi:hypothetical protein